MNVTTAELRNALQARIRELVRMLAPGGHEESGIYKALNPTRNDRSIGSFVMWLTGDGSGAWVDYATGDKGDVFDLISYCKGFPRKGAKTFQWAKRWTGLENGALPAGRVVVKPRAEDPAAIEKERQKLIGNARAMWFNADKELAVTKAETYFRSRGIHIAELARAPGAIRFRKSLEYFEGKHCIGLFPAILSAMTREGEGIVAVHRTYLNKDGTGKADVPSARKVYGDVKGSAIYISRGESNLPVKEASECGIADTLVLCEGIEDGLSIALAEPNARVWAAYSLSNLAEIRLPPCAYDVVVWADNDWGKPQAEQQFARAIEALAKQNPRLRVARSTVGKDANDLLRAGAAA